MEVKSRGSVQELESCLEGNGELLKDHTDGAKRVDWGDSLQRDQEAAP